MVVFTGVKDISAIWVPYHVPETKWRSLGGGFNHDDQLGNGTMIAECISVQMINQDGTPFNEVVALDGGTRETSFLQKGWYGLGGGKK